MDNALTTTLRTQAARLADMPTAQRLWLAVEIAARAATGCSTRDWSLVATRQTRAQIFQADMAATVANNARIAAKRAARGGQ